MTGHLMVEWAERGFQWNAWEGLTQPSGLCKLSRSMEQACADLNAEYQRLYPDRCQGDWKMHPFDIEMECNGRCWAYGSICRPEWVGGEYRRIRGQSVYFCMERECKARRLPP